MERSKECGWKGVIAETNSDGSHNGRSDFAAASAVNDVTSTARRPERRKRSG